MLSITDKLIKTILGIRGDIVKQINHKLHEFETVNRQNSKRWFSELCFCILTANSKAHTAINIQKELKADGFCELCVDDVRDCIIRHKHRFHNNKSKYIVEARKHKNIKITLKKIIKEHDSKAAREWLVANIKGIGYKEASHFLRNIGYFHLAILDRHIINLMVENKIIKRPKILNKKNYIKIEDKFNSIAKKLKMTPAELDMRMWYLKTGEVLK